MSGIYIPNMTEEMAKEHLKGFIYVSVPDHGRLIDADALMENAQYKGTHDIVTAWDIVAAPTIIPADPADKEGEE